MLQSLCRELLAIATPFHKLILQCDDLLIEQIVRLVDDADHRIGTNEGIFMIEPVAVELVTPSIGQIRPIRPMRRRHGTHGFRFPIILAQLRAKPVSDEILIIQEQLLQARAGHVYQPEFRLAGGS
jgi:hypothetical protein